MNVVVAATHDHQAPDTMGLWGPAEGRSGINEAYNSFVVERVAQAAAEAVRRLKPAIVIMGQAHPSDLDTLVHDDRPPEVHDAGVVRHDQWTMSSDYDGHRPLYRIALDDAVATELYVSSTSGEVVLTTTGRTRGWNYAGSVMYWNTFGFAAASTCFIKGTFTRLKKYSNPIQVIPARKWIQRKMICTFSAPV